jgi:hypothetical protein
MPRSAEATVRDFATGSDVMSLCPLWNRTGAGLTRADIDRAKPEKHIDARPAAARAVSLSALTGDGSQMIIASSSIRPIPITRTATATGS